MNDVLSGKYFHKLCKEGERGVQRLLCRIYFQVGVNFAAMVHFVGALLFWDDHFHLCAMLDSGHSRSSVIATLPLLDDSWYTRRTMKLSHSEKCNNLLEKT